MDDADAIELAEIDVDRLILVCHKQGLNYFQILRIFLNASVKLQIMSSAEYYLNQSKAH